MNQRVAREVKQWCERRLVHEDAEMNAPDGSRSWSTERGSVMRAVQRPDGAWSIRLPEDHLSDWADLLSTATADIHGAMLVSRPGDDAPRAVSELRRAGFVPARSETVWRLPLAGLLAKPRVRTVHQILTVTSLDADTVAALDNRIRHDIPGTGGWVGTGAELTASLDDPQFDPDLYLVAQHATTGSLDGLIRVWNRSPEPRLGCIGVTRPWRRTRLVPALMQEVASTLLARGVSHITAETDATNRGSHQMATHHGGQRIQTTIEWRNTRPGRAG